MFCWNYAFILTDLDIYLQGPSEEMFLSQSVFSMQRKWGILQKSTSKTKNSSHFLCFSFLGYLWNKSWQHTVCCTYPAALTCPFLAISTHAPAADSPGATTRATQVSILRCLRCSFEDSDCFESLALNIWYVLFLDTAQWNKTNCCSKKKP